jgi:hypothetical protein
MTRTSPSNETNLAPAGIIDFGDIFEGIAVLPDVDGGAGGEARRAGKWRLSDRRNASE